jgi:hypothetical protein
MGDMNLHVGQKATRSLALTMEQVRAYAEITGDYNPLHFDESFVGRTRFGHLIVQGGLTTGLLHALVAMDMPGRGLCSSARTGSSPRRCSSGIPSRQRRKSSRYIPPSQTRLQFKITRQTGEVVLEGEAWCYTVTPDGA